MKDLTKGNIFKTFFLFGLPLVLSGLLTQTYSIVDASIAGQFLGEQGLAATSATNPLNTFISSVIWGFCVGFSIYIARLFAAKENHKLKSAFYTCLILIFFVAAILGITLIFLYSPIAKLLKIDTQLQHDAFLYFAVINGGRCFIAIGTLLVFTLNSLGVSGYTFWMSLLSGILNIVGNVLSVIVFKIGVTGIALSTVLSASIVNLLYLLKIRRCFSELDDNGKPIRLNLSYLKHSLPYALPNMAQQSVMYFVGLLISPLVNGMGIAATASYSVVNHIYNVIAGVYQNSARTLSTYTAQCVGSKQYKKVNKGVGVGLLQGLAFATPFILVCIIFHKAVCGIFLKANASDLTKEYAYTFVKFYLPFIYFNVLNNLFHALYRGVKAMRHLFCMTLFGALTRFAISALLIPSMGMHGFFVGWVVSWIAEAIVTTSLYFIGKWKPHIE